MEFKHEIKRFKEWAITQNQLGEWELEYPYWEDFECSFYKFVNETEFSDWQHEDWHNIIYAVARDNECENFIDKLSENSEILISLGQIAITSKERDAKWQVAHYLGETVSIEFAEAILLNLFDDEDEYVSRRTLQALSILGSNETERLAEIAWETNHLYQRIAVLHALNEVKSEKFDYYLRLAIEDGREHLISNVKALQKQN